MQRHRSSAAPLALVYTLLVVYASLYPFTGWRGPSGASASDLLTLPWPPWHVPFDIAANLLGYLPLGALIYGAMVRSGWRVRLSLLLAVLGPAALAFAMETAQQFLPGRVPSLKDLATNALGALLGALLAAALQRLGWIERWQATRDRWFIDRSAGALALLLLWPFGLLFPAPLPLGLGQIGDELRALAEAALSDTPWAAALEDDWLAARVADALPLSPLGESLGVALGLLAPCLLAYAAMHPGWRRALLALGAALTALATMTLSTALNFGPDHALAWLSPVTLPALGLGLLLALGCAVLGQRVAAGLCLVVLTALIALVSQAPADAYYAASLESWAQGRFIRFHGLARWIGWLWPYLAMLWLLLRLGARDQNAPPGSP